MHGERPNRWLGKFSLKGITKRGLFIRAFLASFLIGAIGLVGLVVIVSASPSTGAQGADWLRNLLGNKPVADVEAIVFTVQDTVHHLLYRLEQVTPSAPWEVSITQGTSPVNTGNKGLTYSLAIPRSNFQSSTSSVRPTETDSQNPNNTNPINTPVPGLNSSAGSIFTIIPQPANPNPNLTPNSAQKTWMPSTIAPLGSIPDEGIWTAYIQDPSGATLAYRTFLQPDTERPYVVVGIVAFDLSRVRLHYQLGTLEPVVPGRAPGTGQIPAPDRLPGTLLAAFNVGFKTIHGHYGVFMDGKILIPPIDGMGTIAIYQDGSIRIGEWGVDLNYSPDMVVYRQNCPLMVHNGEINPLVYNNSVNDWGGTISGKIVTFRSGIGISQDGKTLYYFAGKNLTMPVLAKAMQDAGAYEAMQLDINNYLVHFTKFELQDNQLLAIPLLPKEMVDNIRRYLNIYPRDFFYVTARNP
jgi:hypothetical protein